MESTVQEICNLAKTKMIEQGAFDKGAYDEIIEETIVYFKERGKLIDDDNEEFIKNQVAEMLENAKKNLAE